MKRLMSITVTLLFVFALVFAAQVAETQAQPHMGDDNHHMPWPWNPPDPGDPGHHGPWNPGPWNPSPWNPGPWNPGPWNPGTENDLLSTFMTTPPTLDGQVDTVWSITPTTVVNVRVPFYPFFWYGYFGNSYQVTMRSLYTDSDVYFLFEWTGDNEESLERQAWYHNETEGKWMQKPKKEPDAYSNPAYEDKFAVIWDIDNSIGFERTMFGGCALMCHGEYMATNAEGERGDTWHWKRDRTGPTHQVDDKWIGFSDEDGRESDEGTGAYSDNKQTLVTPDDESVDVPLYWIPGQTNYHWILKTEIDDGTAKQIVDIDEDNNLIDEDGNILEAEDFTLANNSNLNSSMLIPSIQDVKPATGSRGDVEAWEDYDESTNTWRLEIKRKLITGNEDDIQFNDLNAEYWFSIGVFDAAAIAHAIPGGMMGMMGMMGMGGTGYKFVFLQE